MKMQNSVIFVEKSLKVIKLKTKKFAKLATIVIIQVNIKVLHIVYVRPIMLSLSFMVILYVNIMMWDAVIIWLFSVKSTKHFVNINTFLEIN